MNVHVDKHEKENPKLTITFEGESEIESAREIFDHCVVVGADHLTHVLVKRLRLALDNE